MSEQRWSDGLATGAGRWVLRSCVVRLSQVADRALSASSKCKQSQAEAYNGPQGRCAPRTLKLSAGSIVDDASEKREFGRSLCASLGVWCHAALFRHVTRRNPGWSFLTPEGFRRLRRLAIVGGQRRSGADNGIIMLSLFLAE